MNDQILESERKIRDKLERLTADPVEEANQEKGMFTVFFPVFQTVYYFLFSSDQYAFLSFFSFFHVTNRCPVSLRRAKLTQGLSPVATKSQHCN